MKKAVLSVFLFFITSFLSHAASLHNSIRILVLIIASDDYPIYIELQKIWRTYMHNYPKQVEAYFIKADQNLKSDFIIEGDTLWIQANESIKPGIINKTIKSFEIFLPRIKEFDYVLRTNLSSFYIFPKLLNKLKTCPRKQFYFGSACGTKIPESNRIITIGSGSGFILSPDLVAMLIKHKDQLINNQSLHDDEIIGLFFHKHAIPLQRHARADFYSLNEWLGNKAKIASHVFQYRIKGPTWDMRLQEDIKIHKELLKTTYNILV